MSKKKDKKDKSKKEIKQVEQPENLISTKLGFTKMNVRLNVDYLIGEGYYL